MKIKKNGKVIRLTESDLKKIVKRVLTEENMGSSLMSMSPSGKCIDGKTTPEIKEILNKLTNLGYKCHGATARSILVKKTISCPDGIEKDIFIDITEKEGFWDPKPGDLHYLVVSDPSGPDREIVPGYEYEPIKLFKVKSLENKIKRKLC